MKDATGELSMTVVTIVAVVAVLAIWNMVKEPVTDWVMDKFKNLTGDENLGNGNGAIIDLGDYMINMN